MDKLAKCITNKMICGEDIPSWVNRLAYISTFVPFIERMIPREWISPIAVQHTVESHMNDPPTASTSNGTGGQQSKPNENQTNNGIWSYLMSGLGLDQPNPTQSQSPQSPPTK